MNENEQSRKRDTIEERLSALEEKIVRLSRLIDGDASYRITGLPEKLSAYIDSDASWKRDTEKRIQEAEKRITLLEDEKLGRKIVLEQSQAVLYAIIIILFVVVVWLASSYFQNSGGGKVALPIMPFLLSIEPRIIQGFLWKFSVSYPSLKEWVLWAFSISY